jgi:hypothetical protein
MELPKELYILMFILGDDVEITKILRTLCKLSLSASYDYFEILLKKDIILYHDYYGRLYLTENINTLDIIQTHRRAYDFISRKPTSFKITIKNLYSSIEATQKKDGKVTFEPFHCG